MKELKVGERVTITIEAVEQDGTCDGCFFDLGKFGCNNASGILGQCVAELRSDNKNVIFKEVKE